MKNNYIKIQDDIESVTYKPHTTSNIKQNTITDADINKIISETEFSWLTVYDKCTVMVAKLKCGFIITESSASVDKNNYDFKLGQEICIEKLKNKLWELEGYRLQYKNDMSYTPMPPNTIPTYAPNPYYTDTTFTQPIITTAVNKNKED